jgi:hypothetical protein
MGYSEWEKSEEGSPIYIEINFSLKRRIKSANVVKGWFR